MPKENLELDEKDRQIISLLVENPEMSQSEIAEKIGISQPSVGVRLKKLKQKGAISFVVGMDFKRVGLYLAKVELTAKNTAEIVEKFKNCPYFINGLITSGKNNLCLFFMSEDISTIDSIVDVHLRNDPNVDDVEINIIITPAMSFVLPVKMSFEKTEHAPCGSNGNCGDCSYYKAERCLGCPSLGFYRGNFWK